MASLSTLRMKLMSVELKDSPKVDSAKIAVVDGKGPCLLEKHVIGTLGLIKIIH